LVRGHATKWLAPRSEWNPSTKARAGSILKICFRWAVEEGLISKNPFATLKKEGELRRERVLTAEEWQTMLSIAREPFKTFLLAVRLSGCRPGEVRKVTTEMVDLEDGCWVIPTHKTREKTKEPRIVWLSPELLELTKRQMARGPGFLFRNNIGGQWSEGSVVNAFDRLRKRMGLGLDVVLYSLRHSYATEALETLDVATVAELLGHKGVGTLMRNYAHLRKRGNHMRAAAAKAIGCASASSAPAAAPAGNPEAALQKS
jgi:integrase